MIPGLRPETRELLIHLLGPTVLHRLAEAPSGAGLVVTSQGTTWFYPEEYQSFLSSPQRNSAAVFIERSFQPPRRLLIRGPVPAGKGKDVQIVWCVLSLGDRNAWDIFAQLLGMGDYLAQLTKRFGTCLVFKSSGQESGITHDVSRLER